MPRAIKKLKKVLKIFIVCEKLKKNKPKMSWLSKFKLQFALKLNFNVGQFYREISKLGYLKKLEKVKIKMQWLK